MLQSRAGRFHLAQDFFHVPQKLLAGLGEQHAFARAIEQAAADLLLERLDRVADAPIA